MGRQFDVFAMPLSPVGRFAIVFKDVTERRRAEVALRTAARLDAFRAHLAEMTASLLADLERQEHASRQLELLTERVGRMFDGADEVRVADAAGTTVAVHRHRSGRWGNRREAISPERRHAQGSVRTS